jgi:hypothetical protein
MTVKYDYKCNLCEFEYSEQRGATETQYFVNCSTGDGGTFQLVNETVISETVERVAGPAPEVIEELAELTE